MKNYVTSAVLEEAPCMNLSELGLVAKLNTSKGYCCGVRDCCIYGNAIRKLISG